MADHSLASLLTWMKEPQSQVMWGWDAIAALARGKTNTLLIQDYINRFSTGSYLPPISADIQTVENKWLEHIHDYVLDAPRLSFEIESAEGAEFVKGVLTMAVMGGSQISMEKKVDHWVAAKVRWISPLQGPQLFLDLQLERVPGVVKDDGRVYLDLRFSDNFRLTFASTPTEQLLGGVFFQELFTSLPDVQRVLLLGVIKEGGNPLMRPQTFKLAARSSHKSGEDGFGDGAMLVFIQMEGSVQGGMPGADYRYLIPDDAGKDYSATVLFSRERVTKAAPVVESIVLLASEMLDGGDFDYVHNAEGKLVSATSRNGWLQIGPITFSRLGPFHWEGAEDILAIDIEASKTFFHADPPSPASVSLNSDYSVALKWASQADTVLICRLHKAPPRPPATVIINWRISLSLDVKYGLSTDRGGELILEPLEFNCQIEQAEQVGGATDQRGPPDPWFGDFVEALRGWLAADFIDLEPRIRTALNKFTRADVPLGQFMQESIELSFGQSITDTTQYAPRDIGAFGHVNPATTAFAISPLEPRLFIGASQQFTVTPPTPVTWTVEHLLRNAGSPGTISIAGLYTAPAGIAGNYLRVRVTASASNGFKSSALVTILPSRLTVNPLIQLCNPGDSVELEGGTLNGAALDWKLVSTDPDSGTLTPQAGKCIYTAKHNTTNKAFVLDEIKVSGEGDAASVYVLVARNTTSLKIKPDPEAVLPVGQVQMRASVINEVQAIWSLPLGGPGQIDAQTGIYTSAPDAPDRFVLVFAEHDGDYGLFEGQAILPLPLTDFTPELQLMSI